MITTRNIIGGLEAPIGRPIIFTGVDLAQRARTVAGSALLMAGCLLAAGAVVGGVHGALLVRLAGSRGESPGAA